MFVGHCCGMGLWGEGVERVGRAKVERGGDGDEDGDDDQDGGDDDDDDDGLVWFKNDKRCGFVLTPHSPKTKHIGK